MSYTFTNRYTKPNDSVEINFWSNDILTLIDSYFDQGKITQKPVKTVDGLTETWTTIFNNQDSYNEFMQEPVNQQNCKDQIDFCNGNLVSYSLETPE
jgi:hypothetical protein